MFNRLYPVRNNIINKKYKLFNDIKIYFQITNKHTRIDGSRGSSITVQFQQTHVGEADLPWAKKTGNNAKKDQFFMSIHGIPDSWDESKEESCFNLMVFYKDFRLFNSHVVGSTSWYPSSHQGQTQAFSLSSSFDNECIHKRSHFYK